MYKKTFILTPELLYNSPNLNKYIKNLLSIIDKDRSAYNYIQYLNKALEMINNIHKKKKLFGKLTGATEDRCIEAIAELSYMWLWKHLGWNFEFEPNIETKTPDFKVTTDENNCFIAEVTILRSNHPHRETIISYDDGKIIIKDKNTGEILEKPPSAPQPIEQYKKIIYEIDQKYKKYLPVIKNKLPFIICFYLPDTKSEFYINDFQIERALFGEQTMVINKNDIENSEYGLYPKKNKGQYGNDIYTGIFCFEEYSDVTAILFINNEYYNNKYSFGLKIYLNPFGVWHNASGNPFTKKGLLVNDVDAIHFEKRNIVDIY